MKPGKMSIAEKISAYNRAKKMGLFLNILKPTSESTIIDVGFSDEEYGPSDNFLEKHYPYPGNITALGIDAPHKFSERYPLVKAVTYKGGIFPFRDKQFDICWSNAVIEHVGRRDSQVLFLREAKRVADSVFITTPNRYFPIEVHTRTPLLHLLPKNLFDKYLCITGKKWATDAYMNILSLREIKNILSDAHISGYKIIRNRFLFFTLDFIIIF
ncbi:MAG: methyltransferase domain-containing protein [Candidatus Omnitrophota bacterium]